MKKMLLLFSLLLLLAGCAPARETGPQPSAPGPEDVPQIQSAPEAMDLVGVYTHSFLQRQEDDRGYYLTYAGGEARVQYRIQSAGHPGNPDMGILLLLDGVPQPYHTPEDPENAYLHTFPPSGQGFELIFTPVTGGAGQEKLLTVVRIPAPDYRPDQGTMGFALSNGGQTDSITLRMEADPGVCPIPPANIEAQISLRQGSKAGKSDALYQADVAWLKNEAQRSFLCRIALSGDPRVEWSLVVYVDNQPVALQDLRTEAGVQTLADVALALPEDGSWHAIYAILVPKNMMDPALKPELYNDAYLSDTIFQD